MREPELGGHAGFAVVDALGDELRGVLIGGMRRKRRGPKGGFAWDGVDVGAQVKEWSSGVDRGRYTREVARDIDRARISGQEALHPGADLAHECGDGGGLGERRRRIHEPTQGCEVGLEVGGREGKQHGEGTG